MKYTLWLLLFCIPIGCNAEIYRWQDAGGSTHFSDRPTPEAKIVPILPSPRLYKVKQVYDGDTIQLEDDRKIRFLGINAPEIAHYGKPAEMGGEAAKEWLKNKLQHSKVRLEFDEEQSDHYGRTLAYVFSEDQENINVQLVAAGLATVNIYPPNFRYANQLETAEIQAERAKLGLWQQTEYAVISANELDNNSNYLGWTRIVGKVQSVRNTKKYSYLNFSNNFAVRIQHDWEKLFPVINDYHGKILEVRGWLNKNKQNFFMLIRHPSAIKPR